MAILLTANAQIVRDHYKSTIEETSDSAKIFLSLQASTFFNNNEYFDAPIEGYTLTGAWLQPVLFYQVNPKLRIGGGLHLMKYNGRNDLEQAFPVFRVDYYPMNNLSITMGSFNGGMNHQLPEAVYYFENHFTDILNNGIRIKYQNAYIHSNTWLNWEQFIEPGDPFQEELSFGSQNKVNVTQNGSSSLSLPVNLFVHHRGGQINNNNLPVTTAFEISFGFNLWMKSNISIFDSLCFHPLIFINEGDANDSNGNAFYPEFTAFKNDFGASIGYFRGHLFRTTYGDPIFFNFPVGSEFFNENRDIVSFKLAYEKKIGKNSSISARFNGYYDLNNMKFQYNYGLFFSVAEKIKK